MRPLVLIDYLYCRIRSISPLHFIWPDLSLQSLNILLWCLFCQISPETVSGFHSIDRLESAVIYRVARAFKCLFAFLHSILSPGHPIVRRRAYNIDIFPVFLLARCGDKQVAVAHHPNSSDCFNLAIWELVSTSLGFSAEFRGLSHSLVRTAGVENRT